MRISKKGDVILGIKHLEKFVYSLPDGDYFVEFYQEKNLRKNYFKKLEIISNDLGYTKNELHQMCKELLNSVFKDPENLNVTDFGSIEEYSTKYLSPQGWKCYLDSISLWCLDNFDYVI